MDHFRYSKDHYHAEDVQLSTIAENVGTPFYCYSHATLSRHFKIFQEAFQGLKATVCFAMKSNSNLAVLKTLASLGSGADVVSGGEIFRALKVGIPAKKIIYSGVGKTREEIAYALKENIFQFNIESEPELHAISEVATSLGKLAHIAFRINPDVDAKTHQKITTGRKEDKFGIDWIQARDMYKKAKALDGVLVQGIATHIGSQLTELVPFEQAFRRIRELVEVLRVDGHHINTLDLGGGLGIPYDEEDPPQPEHYADVVRRSVRDLDCALYLEPGRLIVGNAGVLVTKVIYVKQTPTRKFIIVDAAMNDLLRPMLYDAEHVIIPVQKSNVSDKEWERVDVVGPVCESSDFLAKYRRMPPVKAGDLLAIRTAGAYGASMSSTYNSRLLVPEVLVKGSEFSVIRRRPSYEEMVELEQIPAWV